MRYLHCSLILIILLAALFILYNSMFLETKQKDSLLMKSTPDPKLIKKAENRTKLKENLKLEQALNKKPQTDIFFLKIHKCASSTIQNIIMRFGLKHGLDFVLPTKNNYLGNPKYFDPSMVEKSIRTTNGKYNIFTHHTRFNETSIWQVMNDNAVFTTILRNPAELYVSLYHYYKLEKRYHMNLTTLIANYSIASQIRRGKSTRFGFNQMCFDLGLQEKYFNKRRKVKKLISRMERNFKLVMLADYMEESLILLADLMNWPLDNVVSIALNVQNSVSKMKLTSYQRKILRRLNYCDATVHNYYLKKFKAQIIRYGVDRMKKQIKELLHLNENFKRDCIEEKYDNLETKIIKYKIRNTTDPRCSFATRSELSFTTLVRQIQKDRVSKITTFERLMRET